MYNVIYKAKEASESLARHMDWRHISGGFDPLSLAYARRSSPPIFLSLPSRFSLRAPSLPPISLRPCSCPPSHLPTNVPSLINFFVISFHPFLSVLPQCSTMLTPHAVNRLNQNPSMEDVFGKNIVGSFWGSSVLPHVACKVWCMTYFAEKVAVIFVRLKPDQLNMPSITAVYGIGTPE